MTLRWRGLLCSKEATTTAMLATRALALALLAFVSGCADLAEIRTHHGAGTDVASVNESSPDADCRNGNETVPSRANSIEDYDDFWLGYVELDDEGWTFDSRGQPKQIEAFATKLTNELRAQPDTDFLVVAFIHGWHHNAHDNDCNVHEFRAMLKTAQRRYAALYPKPLEHKRRVVGLYIGWRGETLNMAGLRYTTILDRRNAAERVAKGDVRGVFALLRRLQVGEVRDSGRPDRMRSVVVGHSFGGLIAFHGLSQALLNELTLTKPETGRECQPIVVRSDPNPVTLKSGAPEKTARTKDDISIPVFPDMLVLINPAFEGTRFETIHGLMYPVDRCEYPQQRPKLVVVTADNDVATGPVLTAGREVLTLLEKYPADPSNKALERQANTHAVGFIDRYQTHRLCLRSAGDQSRAVAVWQPSPQGDWPTPDRFAPVWVVGAPPEIVDGHNGFLFAKPNPATKIQQPYLLNWLITLHAFGVKDDSPALAAGCESRPPAP
jgi:pimeloyl-ACP methyl ester carboxylesterase